MEYKSQIGQDKFFIENINDNRKNLYFVDIGAHNGITFSNTYCLEKYLDWSGLCVEANDETYTSLINNRNCKCINECIYSISGIEKELEIPLNNPLLEGNDMIVRIKNPDIKNDFWAKQFEKTRIIKKITKTLTEIFKENNVPSLINYMSIDIEGYDLDALKGLDFTQYTIEFLTIEWGGADNNKPYLKNIQLFLESKGYSLSRINRWDAEFRNIPIVNSFDVFDTLLARKVINPSDIFKIIEKDYPFTDFFNIRCNAQSHSNGTFDDIYKKVQELYNIPLETCEKLKEYEIQMEIKYSYLIETNCNRVKDGDILISDMYLSDSNIMRLLNSHGYNKNTKIFASPCGKSSGNIWNSLKKLYIFNLHLGDNEYADVKMANLAGINAELTNIHKLNETELFFLNNGKSEFAFLLREFRHKNPYSVNTNDYELYNDMITFNIPCLIMISNILNDIMIKEERTTLLLVTRDGCLLKHIFTLLYPKYKCLELESSRKIHNNPNQEYKDYLKTMYNHKTCIIFDLYGGFQSGRNLYKELFGEYPRVHLFGYNNYFKGSELYTGLTYSSTIQIESFNLDTIGSLIRLENGKFIRGPLIEYNILDANIYKNTVLSFCNFIKNRNLPDINNLLKEFLEKIKRVSHINTFENNKNLLEINNNTFIWNHPSLTDIANACDSYKGSIKGCKHNYTDYYEIIFSSFINKPISILELGLNRYDSNTIPSIKLWKTYFGNYLKFYGFDSNNNFMNFNNLNDNVSIIIGDMCKSEDLSKCLDNSYNIIIDDECHSSKSQQIALKILWNSLQPGGLYCIESLHWQPTYDTHKHTKDILLDWKEYIDNNKSFDNIENYTFINKDETLCMLNQIEKIEFFKSKSPNWSEDLKKYALCVIYKKTNLY